MFADFQLAGIGVDATSDGIFAEESRFAPVDDDVIEKGHPMTAVGGGSIHEIGHDVLGVRVIAVGQDEYLLSCVTHSEDME